MGVVIDRGDLGDGGSVANKDLSVLTEICMFYVASVISFRVFWELLWKSTLLVYYK